MEEIENAAFPSLVQEELKINIKDTKLERDVVLSVVTFKYRAINGVEYESCISITGRDKAEMDISFDRVCGERLDSVVASIEKLTGWKVREKIFDSMNKFKALAGAEFWTPTGAQEVAQAKQSRRRKQRDAEEFV